MAGLYPQLKLNVKILPDVKGGNSSWIFDVTTGNTFVAGHLGNKNTNQSQFSVKVSPG